MRSCGEETSEYAAATNLALNLPALHAFIGGRGAQEKSIATEALYGAISHRLAA